MATNPKGWISPSLDPLWYLAMAGMVGRYHTAPHIKTDTVGEHSWGVAMWCCILTNWQCSADLLVAALTHDVGEMDWGDLPAPTKRALGISKQFAELEEVTLLRVGVPWPELVERMTAEDWVILKLADIADGLLHCCYERMLGNLFIGNVFENFWGYYNEMMANGKVSVTQADVFLSIRKIWGTYEHE